MEALKKIRIASDQSQDLNKGKTTWVNGILTQFNEGPKTTLYLFHEFTTEIEYPKEGDPIKVPVTYAFPVRVDNPIRRDQAINNAEMQRYGLYSAMDVASLNAALARKSRSNSMDDEVIEHDNFMEAVKDELTRIGII